MHLNDPPPPWHYDMSTITPRHRDMARKFFRRQQEKTETVGMTNAEMEACRFFGFRLVHTNLSAVV